MCKLPCAWLSTSDGREKVDVQPRKMGGTRDTDGPSLRDFIMQQHHTQQSGVDALKPRTSAAEAGEDSKATAAVPYLSESDLHGRGRRGGNAQWGMVDGS